MLVNPAQLWIDFETLLTEAVKRNSFTGVELLLEYELKFDAEPAQKPSAQKCPKPLICAAINGNLHILKLFHKHHYTIPHPDKIDCQCEKCLKDKLGQSKQRIATLRALSSPVWISLTSEDPFLDSFKLCELNRKYGDQDDSFGKMYEELSIGNEQVCLDLLDEIESEDEGSLLMRHKSLEVIGEQGIDLSFLNLALDNNMKEVVAHPILQHFLLTRVFDDIPGWRSSGLAYKSVFVMFAAVCFPFTTLLNILPPFGCCAALSEIAMKPFVKFVNGAASFITFLILLGVLGASSQDGIRKGNRMNATEALIFMWLLGFCVGEVKQIHKRGFADYFSSGWNWIDTAMDVLMFFAYVAWIVLAYYKPINHLDLRHFADGMFAFGIILSFFRVVYLCQITRYLGLLQLCLGSMVQVIFQFAFISMVVVLAFSVSMVFLFMASDNHDIAAQKYEESSANKTAIYRALTENYNGIVTTTINILWTGVGMGTTNNLKDFNDGSLIQLWAHATFMLYFAISIIVLLNMLIAMMNKSYEAIQNNLETEHKYSRTNLWLEYISDEQTRPVPFNLIPTMTAVKTFLNYIYNAFRSCRLKGKRERYPTMKREARQKYKQLCGTLMERYMFKRYGFSCNDEIPPQEETENASFLQKVKVQLETWSTVPHEGKAKDGIDNSAYSGHQVAQLYTSDEIEVVGTDTTRKWKNSSYNVSQL